VGPNVVIEAASRWGREPAYSRESTLAGRARGALHIASPCHVYPARKLATASFFTRCGDRVGWFRIRCCGRAAGKVSQLGKIVIEDDVEIGCNTTLDRARWARP